MGGTLSKLRNAYEVALPGGRSVVFAELKTGELEQAMTLAGEGPASEWRLGLEGLRLSLRKIGDRTVAYTQLQGAMWDDEFDIRETLLLADAWRSVHMPSDEEVKKARGNLKAVSGPSGT